MRFWFTAIVGLAANSAWAEGQAHKAPLPIFEMGAGSELHGPITVRTRDGVAVLSLDGRGRLIGPLSITESRIAH